MKTRSKPAGSSSNEVIQPVVPKALPTPDVQPRKAFIVPDSISETATIVTLANPRSLRPTRYYHCKKAGFYEIKQVSSGVIKKSLLLVPEAVQEEPDSNGYVCKTASFFTVTPIDALYLLLPALSPPPKDTKEHKPMFLSLDDHLDTLGETSKHLRRVCEDGNTLALIERQISLICDQVSAGDENMYRLNHDKLLKFLVSRAEAMVKAGLPPSMEAHFVKKPLEVPMAALLQEPSIQKSTLARSETIETDATSSTTGTVTPADSSFTADSQSTNITVPDTDSYTDQVASPYVATDSIRHLQRLRVALSFLLQSYIPSHLSSPLESLLTLPKTPVDFSPLTTHLAALSSLKASINSQARELISGDSRKRMLEDEEAGMDREEKKRKKEEEERKKKAGESRGVRDLKKVNTTGMKKMSDFFSKKG